MIIRVLGCGSSGGVPMVGGFEGKGGNWGRCDPLEPRNRRTRASILIEHVGKRLLIDTGPDLRAQLLRENVSRLDGVLYTHDHADHLHGVDDIRGINQNLNKAIPVWGDAATLDRINRRFPYVFTPLNPKGGFYKPSLIPNPISPPNSFIAAGIEVQPFWQIHGAIPSIGYRVGSVAYSTDCKDFPPESEPFLQDLDLWIIDCTQIKPHPTHANLERALEWAERYRPKRCILTHLSVDLDYGWLRSNVPTGVEPAYDGMVLTVP